MTETRGRDRAAEPPEIPADGTLGQMFAARAAATPDAVAYLEYSRTLGKWFEHRWSDVLRRAGEAQALLRELGLGRGDRIGVMARAGTYWVILDLAAAGLGVVTVPLYYRDGGGNAAYAAARSRMKVLFLGDEMQWAAVAPARAQMPGVARIFSAAEIPDAAVETFLPAAERHAGAAYEVAEADPRATATVVFTSGTTGPPKGVMLSHANILGNAAAATRAVPIGPGDRLLSFLPLSHMFERTVGYYAPMLRGAAVAFARSVHTLRQDLRAAPPTVLVAVPRIYEKIHAALAARAPLDAAPGRALLALARRAGRAGARSPWRLLAPLPRALIGRRVRQGLGGRLRLAITGGAALDPEVGELFAGLGLPVLQGYGLTETSPVLSVNRLEDLRCDTVGPPIDGVEARLGEGGELLARGPGVMQGYLDDPEATAAALDAAGWFRTGDRAEFDRGHLRIIGRIKEIIVLSTGEKVPPEDLERALCRDPRIAQAWVSGEGRPFLAAVVVAAAPGVGAAELLADCPRLLRGFPGYARIGRLRVETEPWSADNGCLTATLKLRRAALAEKYRAELEAFYA